MKRGGVTLSVIVALGLSEGAAYAQGENVCVRVDGAAPADGWDTASIASAISDGDASIEIVAHDECANEDQSAVQPPEEPEEESALAFKPIRLKGKGDKVARFKIPEDASAIATFNYSGRSNFIVTAYTFDGGGDLLINEIGNYNGEVLLPDETFLLVVEGHGGSWSASAPS